MPEDERTISSPEATAPVPVDERDEEDEGDDAAPARELLEFPVVIDPVPEGKTLPEPVRSAEKCPCATTMTLATRTSPTRAGMARRAEVVSMCVLGMLPPV